MSQTGQESERQALVALRRATSDEVTEFVRRCWRNPIGHILKRVGSTTNKQSPQGVDVGLSLDLNPGHSTFSASVG